MCITSLWLNDVIFAAYNLSPSFVLTYNITYVKHFHVQNITEIYLENVVDLISLFTYYEK